MKKNVILVALLGVFVACNSLGDKGYLISGEAKGIEDGKNVILQKQDTLGMGFVNVDTVKVKDGKFEIKGEVTEIVMHFLQVEGTQGVVPLILENGKINVTVDKDSIFKSAVKGTFNNDAFDKFNKESMEINKRIQKKMSVFEQQNMQLIQQAQATQDTAIMNKLMKEASVIQQEQKDFFTNYPEKNPKSYISVLILDNMIKDPQADMTKIEKIYKSFDESIKKTKAGKNVEKAFGLKKKIAVGNLAPNFSAKTPEGKTVSLKESLGKITIIDFWASWCAPCRAENPKMVAIYNEFHQKGLNIIGVSLDKDANDWKEAIAKDKLVWTHVSNLMHWNEPIAKDYNIGSIPATFVLDATGKIVARDLRDSELRTKIAELLAK